jgi:hypothetical protein
LARGEPGDEPERDGDRRSGYSQLVARQVADPMDDGAHGGFVGVLVSPGRSGLDHEASSLTDAKVRDRSELMTEVRARAALSMDERTRRASDRDIRSMGEGVVVVRTHPEKAAAGVATEVLDRVPGVRRVKVIDVSRPAAPHQPRPRR